MSNFFTTFFYQPIFNLIIFLYNTVSFKDFGLAIIFFTVIIKLLLLPLSKKAIQSQKSMQEIQPKIDELKAKYKGNQAEMGPALMALYKENKINPFSSCLPLLIQLPFLIAVFQVFRSQLMDKMNLLYPFINKPDSINNIAFGFLDLSKPNVYIAILAGLAQFWQGKMLIPKKVKPVVVENSENLPAKPDDSMTSIMNKQMLYLMPALTVFIGLSLPGGLTFYWLMFTIATALQQLYVLKSTKK